jgi:hypothetical protein
MSLWGNWYPKIERLYFLFLTILGELRVKTHFLQILKFFTPNFLIVFFHPVRFN